MTDVRAARPVPGGSTGTGAIVVLAGPGPAVDARPAAVPADRILTDRVLGWAAERARARGCPLRLVVAADLPGDGHRPAWWWTARAALDRLADRISDAAPGVDVEAELRAGCWPSVAADEAGSASTLVVAVAGADPGPPVPVSSCPVVVLSASRAVPRTPAGVRPWSRWRPRAIPTAMPTRGRPATRPALSRRPR